MISARRTVGALVVLIALLGTGCSREFGPGDSAGRTPGGATAGVTAESARTKLGLQVRDPCYAGDPQQAWPRCARWVEETASSARTAADALPAQRPVTDGAAAVAAGRDAFLGRGCGTGAAAARADGAACVGALLQARDGVRTLARSLGGIRGV